MGISVPARPAGRLNTALWAGLFFVCLGLHFAGALVGWQSKNLPGVEFRQAQTALSAHFIKADHDFSLAYPTPVLGKPWSVPLEFPLYQWTVVAVSETTGWGITKSGRVVSMACFYLTLPALYLLLARWRIAPRHRWLVLAVVVTCPLYVFYSRAVLIETMALMFSLWFWVAYERAVAARHVGWLGLAILSGAAAGTVKVTTFVLYLLPPAAWSVARLWRERKSGRWRGDLAWMLAAVVLPLAATWGWLRYSDAVRALNPSAQFLRSTGVSNFVLGTPATRVSAELWKMKGHIITQELTWFPVLTGLGLLALATRARWREILSCLGVFAVALVAFPELYAYHDYYYVAVAILLMVAMGLVLVALAESAWPRWVVALAALTVVCGQIHGYFGNFYPAQSGISYGGNGLSQSLRALTRPDEYIIVTGQDWNSMTAYYSQRRALMLTWEAEHRPAQMEAALAALDGEKLGALVITGDWQKQSWLIAQGVARGLEAKPLYFWRDTAVFLPVARRADSINRLEEGAFFEVQYAPGVQPYHPQPTGGWYQVATLPLGQKWTFAGMRPTPVRFFSTFGLTLELSNGRLDFGAHPVTRLVFSLPAGHHVLRSTLYFAPDAYRADLAENQKTDGVEVTLSAVEEKDTRRVLGTRLMDPVHRPEDRTRRPLRFEFELPKAQEVELFFGPGPNGRDTRDWIALGQLVID